MSRHPRADLYMADRARGLTYRQIGEKYGVTGQSVQICCAKQGESPRKYLTPGNCIWPNLRVWLNADRERAERFFRAMKGTTIRDILKGIRQPKKNVIDRMLAITGMTYEEMFKEEDHG